MSFTKKQNCYRYAVDDLVTILHAHHTLMEDGEHRFHTVAQIAHSDEWMKKAIEGCFPNGSIDGVDTKASQYSRQKTFAVLADCLVLFIEMNIAGELELSDDK